MIKSDRKNREIGSSFWETEWGGNGLKVLNAQTCNPVFSLSGRTSLLQIIEDVKSCRDVRTAMLPSYCCDSMIEPFIRSGIQVEFYPVVADENGLKAVFQRTLAPDIVLSMSWFGTGNGKRNALEEAVKSISPETIIIRDATHSLLSEEADSGACDYIFASVRKWTGTKGAGVIIKSPEKMEPYTENNTAFSKTISEAMDLKKSYIAGESSSKDGFLRLYAEGESILDWDYAGYGADESDVRAISELNEDYIIQIRKRNFSILASRGDMFHRKGITPLIKGLKDGEVPLFYPVILGNKFERDRLRRYLIDSEVFCPVHWPVTEMHTLSEAEKAIYDRELSIVCDQRYDEEDMERVVDLIYKF